MKIQDKFCTIAQSKKLKRLGILQESLFHHQCDGIVAKTTLGYTTLGCESPSGAPDYWDEDPDGNEYYSAFDTTELGIMLPDLIVTDGQYDWNIKEKHLNRQFEIWCIKEDDCWLVMCVAGNDVANFLHKVAKETEAQARAEMLIYLLERKLITAESVNEKIKVEE